MKLRRLLTLAVLLALAAGAVFLWKAGQPVPLPAGIAAGNGRLEATEVDVASKLAGRLVGVAVREGDQVTAGQLLAELDADDLKAQQRAAEAQVRQARAGVAESRDGVANAGSQRELARTSLERTRQLAHKGFLSGDRLDRDRTVLEGMEAGLAAAKDRALGAEAALSTAQARSEVLAATLKDARLTAPIAGRVLYRLAEPGEVVPAGGKVVTLLDMADVHLSLYLPAEEAGRVALGSPARILLDALPSDPVPARVVFVAPKAQFTPKEVETRNEREKLMFRVKLRVEPAWLATHADLAKPGMPALGYVRTLPDAPWPPLPTPRGK